MKFGTRNIFLIIAIILFIQLISCSETNREEKNKHKNKKSKSPKRRGNPPQTTTVTTKTESLCCQVKTANSSSSSTVASKEQCKGEIVDAKNCQAKMPPMGLAMPMLGKLGPKKRLQRKGKGKGKGKKGSKKNKKGL
jgi:hypothetical protein